MEASPPITADIGSITAVVLAAGRGTRMKSDLPKVLHRLGGEPLVFRPIRAAQAAGAGRVVVVVGFGAPQVRAALDATFDGLAYALQDDPQGTGHAVQMALPAIVDDGPVLVLSGDVPGLTASTLRRLLDACGNGMALGTFRVEDPTGYGRIERDPAGRVRAIVEHRDASESQRAIDECNGGVYCFASAPMREHLGQLRSDNAQGELYLTDLVAAFVAAGLPTTAVQVPAEELFGVNTVEQLAALEAALESPAS